MHDFRRSAGTGLRYITPAGAISLEYGFKLDRRAGESVGQLHFSIGTIF
jgi:outer membrane protein insertion porin family